MVEVEREVMEVAMEAGHILLENGAEIFRVEETINRICRHYWIESGSAFILSNGIFVTSGNMREETFARVQHIPVSGSHLNRVAAVNQLSREVEEGRYTIEEVREHLREIRQMPGKSSHMQIFGSGVGSGAFCYLYGGNLRDCTAAFLAGVVLYAFVLYISSPYFNKMVSNIAGGAVATAACVVLYELGLGQNLDQMVIGSIIPLEDKKMAGQVIAAVAGTIGFSVLYSVPRAYYPYCGIIGGAGWFLYCLLIEAHSAPEATLFAAILVVLLSRLFAVKERCPVTIFLSAAYFPWCREAGSTGPPTIL